MDKTYFVVSDVHSFYSEMREGLVNAGYSSKDKSHVLIVCGDIFDRGSESLKMYHFFKYLPKSRRILVKGNHEQLLLDLVKKDLPEKHDFSNETVSTVLQLAEATPEEWDMIVDLEDMLYQNVQSGIMTNESDIKAWNDSCSLWKTLVNRPKVKEVVEWLQSDVWLDYYEMDRFIFVHSFIPLVNIFALPVFQWMKLRGPEHHAIFLEYFKDWRTDATEQQWDDSRWCCPYKLYQANLFKPEEDAGKTLVCGHWNVQDFHLALNQIQGCKDIYFSKGIIELDGGVYNTWYGDYMYDCNVLVIKDNKLYNKKREELK